MPGFMTITLENNVDGSTGSIQVNPPSGGFTQGSGYRIDFVKSPDDLNTIYAQSNQFNITSSSSTPNTKGTTGA